MFSDWSATHLYSFWIEDRLVAVATCDTLKNGLSAVYTFYDARLEKRSIGTYAILWQIEHTKQIGLDYLYLGYWVDGSPKMAYKKNFFPLEALIDQVWRPLPNDK